MSEEINPDEILSKFDPVRHDAESELETIINETALAKAVTDTAGAHSQWPIFDIQVEYTIDSGLNKTTFEIELAYGHTASHETKTFKIECEGAEAMTKVPLEMFTLFIDEYYKWQEPVAAVMQEDADELIAKQVEKHIREKEEREAAEKLKRDTKKATEELLLFMEQREVLSDPLVAAF